jgi:hypothetical protein
VSANSTARSVLGIAKETVFGTAVPPTAFLPVNPPTPKDNLALLEDKGLRGSMVSMYDEIPGPASSTFDFDGDVFPDTLPWMLTGVLGDLLTTGASVPYSHAISVLNSGDGQTPSYTLTDFYGVAARAYAGAKFSELGVKFAGDGMLTYTAKAVALASAVATTPTAAYTAVPPLAGWTGVVSVGGTVLSNVIDGEVTIKRTVTVVDSVDGSQAPYKLWSGPVTADGKLTLVMEDDSQLINYLTNVKPALDINFTSGTGAALTQVKLHMSSVVYSAADIGRGKDFVELAVTFSAKANVTDVGASAGYSPIKATVQNAVLTGVYK